MSATPSLLLPDGYRGRRERFKTVVEVDIGGQWTPLEPRFDVANHSPDGFEWGYSGSGPAQLALAILLTRIGREDALRSYQRYKEIVVARLPKEWLLSGGSVDLVIVRLRAEVAS